MLPKPSDRVGDRRPSPSIDAKAVLEAAPDAMLVTWGDGEIVFANAEAARLFGYGREELEGRAIEDLIPRRFKEAHVRDRRAFAGAPRPRAIGKAGLQLFGLRRDGSEFPAEIGLSPISVDGAPGVIASIRDVSARVAAEQEHQRRLQAEDDVRVRDEFLSIASHELRSPLATLQLRVDSLQRVLGGMESATIPEKLFDKLGAIHVATERLAGLVGLLLDVSRIAGGRLELARERTDVAAIAREAVALNTESARASGSEVRVITTGPVCGEWDPQRLAQVISNLLTNAIKYGDGQPIDIGITQSGEWARIVVRDHGIGIAPADQERIFGRFERAVSSRSFAGSGLGLWIARGLVEAHGGTLRLESKEGKGSTFTVDLPCECTPDSVYSARRA